MIWSDYKIIASNTKMRGPGKCGVELAPPQDGPELITPIGKVLCILFLKPLFCNDLEYKS